MRHRVVVNHEGGRFVVDIHYDPDALAEAVASDVVRRNWRVRKGKSRSASGSRVFDSIRYRVALPEAAGSISIPKGDDSIAGRIG